MVVTNDDGYGGVPDRPDGDDGGSSGPTPRQGADGRWYIWDEDKGAFVPAPGLPAAAAPKGSTVPAAPRYPAWEDTPLDPAGPYYDWNSPNAVRDLPVTSYGGQQAVAGALGVDQASFAYVQALVEAGVITPTMAQKMLGIGANSAGDGGSGVGWAQLARQAAQDRINNAIARLQILAEERAREDTNRMNAASLVLKAAGIASDAPFHYGFAPESPAVRAGLTESIPTTPIPFDPNIATQPTSFDAKIADQIARIEAMVA